MKNTRDAYKSAGIQLTYGQSMVLAKETYRRGEQQIPQSSIPVDTTAVPPIPQSKRVPKAKPQPQARSEARSTPNPKGRSKAQPQARSEVVEEKDVYEVPPVRRVKPRPQKVVFVEDEEEPDIIYKRRPVARKTKVVYIDDEE